VGEPPADAATDAVREGLAASRAFASVVAAGDALAVERFLDGYVLGFDLVKSAAGAWSARFAVRLSLSDKAGKLLHTGVYETTRDLPGASPRAWPRDVLRRRRRRRPRARRLGGRGRVEAMK